MSADTVSPEVRSRMMAGIKSSNTKPELAVRSALHRRGYRFHLYRKDLPGKPDLVFPKYRAVILIHGCFWHGHDCHLFKWPKTREDFWREKITSNAERDRRQLAGLRNAGWRVATVWECAMKGPSRLPIETVVDSCETWLKSNEWEMGLRGDEIRPVT